MRARTADGQRRIPWSQRGDLPDPPEGLTYGEAIADPLTLPFDTRRKVATEAMMHGLIDGWQALAFMLCGTVSFLDDDDELPVEQLDEHGDWIVSEDVHEIAPSTA